MDLMTSKHARWHEFVRLMLGAQGCDVRTGDDGELIWDGYPDFRITRSVLRTMGDFDASGTIRYLHEVYAAECDTTLLSNCAPKELEEWLENH